MAQLKQTGSILSVERQVKAVKIKMANLASRSTKASLAVMREYSEKVLQRAAEYAPEETGALGSPKNWQVVENKDGVNGRLTFTVKMKPRASRIKNGRSVPVSRYAIYMHDNKYKLTGEDENGITINSKAKAKRLGLSIYPVGSGKFVGRLFLTRSINSYRLKTLEKLKEAVAKELK